MHETAIFLLEANSELRHSYNLPNYSRINARNVILNNSYQLLGIICSSVEHNTYDKSVTLAHTFFYLWSLVKKLKNTT